MLDRLKTYTKYIKKIYSNFAIKSRTNKNTWYSSRAANKLILEWISREECIYRNI